MSVIESIKEHKGLAIGAVVAVVVIYFVTRTPGTSSSSLPGGTLTVGGDVGSATQTQQLQLQADYASKQLDAASRAQSDQTAAQLELGKLSIAQAGAHDQLAATVATSNIDATSKVTSLLAMISGDVEKTKSADSVTMSSIAGDVAKTQSNNNVVQASIIANSATNQQKILADALGNVSSNQRDVAVAGIDATTKIAGINAGAATSIATSRDQNTGGLFGGGGFLGLGIHL